MQPTLATLLSTASRKKKVLRKGETRTIHLGETDAGRVLFVVVTERDGMHRVVTARDAHKNEGVFYLKHKAITNDKDPTDP